MSSYHGHPASKPPVLHHLHHAMYIARVLRRRHRSLRYRRHSRHCRRRHCRRHCRCHCRRHCRRHCCRPCHRIRHLQFRTRLLGEPLRRCSPPRQSVCAGSSSVKFEPSWTSFVVCSDLRSGSDVRTQALVTHAPQRCRTMRMSSRAFSLIANSVRVPSWPSIGPRSPPCLMKSPPHHV